MARPPARRALVKTCFFFFSRCSYLTLGNCSNVRYELFSGSDAAFIILDSYTNSYHKNSLSKEQLEVIVLELQKKVKMLQQRHRRHLEKLVGLENTVSQLRQNNLLNEERLQLLERVMGLKYLQK